jgi:hypothetical protein
MIIKKAKYRKVKKIVTERVSDDVYGCDECKKEIKEGQDKLDMTVFYHDEKLKNQKYGSDNTDSYEFCSWDCVCKFLPKVKTDYFIDLPTLHYDNSRKSKGIMANDFLKLLTKN